MNDSNQVQVQAWRPGTATTNPSGEQPRITELHDHLKYLIVSDEMSPATQHLLGHAMALQLSGHNTVLLAEQEPPADNEAWYRRLARVRTVGFRLRGKDSRGRADTIDAPNLNEVRWSEETGAPASGPNPRSRKFDELALVLHLETPDGHAATVEIETDLVTNPAGVDGSPNDPADISIWVSRRATPNAWTIGELMTDAYHAPTELEEAARIGRQHQEECFRRSAEKLAEDVLLAARPSRPHS